MNKFSIFDDHLGPLEAILAAAKACGATAADAVIGGSTSLSMGMRMGKVESCEQSDSQTLGLRVFIGQQSATVATNDLRGMGKADMAALAERAVAMARAAPADPFGGLADPAQLAQEAYDLDLADPDFRLDAAELQQWAQAMEDVGLQQAGITNSSGASAGASQSRFTLMTSGGFAGSRAETDYGMSVQLVAGTDDGRMVRDYDYSSAVYRGDLREPDDIGREAARRTLRLRGAGKVETMTDIPVIYESRVARGLLSHLLGAINGNAIALGQSFLDGQLGAAIFAPGIMILDEPHLPRGHRSRPFDAEGLPTRPMALVENGRLKNYLLNLHAARQLGMAPTGHAVRGAASQPGIAATNVSLVAGMQTPAQLMGDIKRGLYPICRAAIARAPSMPRACQHAPWRWLRMVD